MINHINMLTILLDMCVRQCINFRHCACCRILLLQAGSPSTLFITEHSIQWALAGMGSCRY